MQEPSISLLQSINPLLKLVKQRQQLYFELLSFVNKHIESSSNDLDNVTIFNRFMNEVNKKNVIIKSREEELVANFINFQHLQIATNESITKEMLRFSSRLIEILEASMAKIRKSIFDDCGRVLREFARFKAMINKILKREFLNIKEYCEYIINFTVKKYIKQVSKIQKYLEKVELGQDTYLRDFYSKNASDHDPLSSEEKKYKHQEIPIRRIDFKLQIKQISPQQHHQKKHSLKKTLKPSTKRQKRTIHQRGKEKPKRQQQHQHQQQQQKPNKEQTANKLFKFYNLLELSKKQFLQDYIYEQIEEQKQKRQLFTKLVQRNKLINNQINNFVRKSSNFIHIPLVAPNRSSGDQRNESSVASRGSSRKNIIIIKKRPSILRLQSSSGNQKHSDNQKKEILESSVVKNLNPRRKSSHSNHRPTVQKSNKKLFVVKPPMIFQDDMIPQAQMNQTQWLHMPITNRYKDRKNENLRLKKKNNPNPMENAMLPDNFRYLM